MIGRIAGTLLEKRPPSLLVDVGGVGYEVEAPMSTIYELPAIGAQVVLLTHLIVREDAHLLFGFRTESERDAFRQLIRVSGVGPRMALAVLSGMSVTELAGAVASQESGRFTRVPGIGKKTAERLLLELKGRIADALGTQAGPAGSTPGDARPDVLHALVALGYSEREADAAARKLPADVPVADGIRQALKLLSKA
ncbi:MAG: Holliday junction branch migration protein RuvA [Burkholderiaceae bacterium]|nr:Holliday junction branch migration protein RuvA [Burkholderiaceae bacterium]